MPTFNQGIRTNDGYDLFGRVQSGQTKIHYTKVVFSSLDLSNETDDDIQNMTDVNPKELIIHDPQVLYKPKTNDSDQETEIRALGSNETLNKGFYINTYALYAADDKGNEILYGVTADDHPSWLPAYDGIRPQALTYNWDTGDKDTNNVHFTDTHNEYATYGDYQDFSEAVNTQLTSVASDTSSASSSVADLATSTNSNSSNISSLSNDISSSSSNFQNEITRNTNLINSTAMNLATQGSISYPDWFGITEAFHFKQGKSYWISANNDTDNSWVIQLYNNSSNTSVAKSNQVKPNNIAVLEFTPSKDQDLQVRVANMQSASGGHAYNICITQSDYYVPYIVAERNLNNISNLTTITQGKYVGFGGDITAFYFQEGKSYWISMRNHVDDEWRIKVQDISYGDPAAPVSPVTSPNDISILHLIPDKTGILFITARNMNKSDGGYVYNLCVTQSQDYVPLSVINNNNNNNNLLSPNLSPKSSIPYSVWGTDMFTFTFHKGITYWISMKNQTDSTWKIALLNGKSTVQESTVMNTVDTLQYKFVSDEDQTLLLHVYNMNKPSGGNVYDICITHTDNYVPFRTAQIARQEIKSILNN